MTAVPDVAPVPSVADVRQRFPALGRREGPHPVAYFDGPGGTQVPADVAGAMAEYLLHHNANTHWAYPTSRETDAIIAEARAALADFTGGAADEIAFGANMTTLTFHLARALGRDWKAGDEVVVTELDHHANVAPWEAVARERGVVLRTVRFDPASGELDWAELERAIGARTRLLAIGAASNALGTVTDVARAAALAHSAGALVFVDAVHYAPHRLLDVHALGADFAACSAYKFYGPHVGVLWGRRHRIEALDVPKLRPAPNAAPERLETGTLNHEGIAGTLAAVDFLASLAPGASRRERLATFYAAEHRRTESLTERLWEGLGAIDGVTRYGPPPGRPRTSTVSFALAGRSSRAVAEALALLGLYVSNGDFYASTVVERLGHAEDGLVRVGLALYSTGDDVARLLDALAHLP
ncbi:MAG TPA: cysteine desulfurase-like protein [Gemmatimonadales bacterium]|nr:cysteine desulfurase-like protein [Gemmatimonadales bacterium]